MVGIDTDIFTTIPNIRREVLFANKGAGFHRTCELSVGRLVLLKRVNANIRTEAFPFREKISVLCDDIFLLDIIRSIDICSFGYWQRPCHLD